MEGYFVEVDFKPVPAHTTTLLEPIAGYNPNMPIHFVLLHLPDHAPKELGSERDLFVDGWMNAQNVSKILQAFKSPDNLRPQGYGWNNRGWAGTKQFETRITASLKKNNSCVLSRKLTYEEAIRLQRRLSNEFCSFRTSAIVFPFKSLSSLSPICPTENTHGTMTIKTTYTACKDCLCNVNLESSIPTRGTTAYACSTCQHELCLLCTYTRFIDRRVNDCQVLSGYLAGTFISFPSQDAALAAVETGSRFGESNALLRGGNSTRVGTSETGEPQLNPEQKRQFDENGFIAFQNADGNIQVMIDGSRYAGQNPTSIPGFNEMIRSLQSGVTPNNPEGAINATPGGANPPPSPNTSAGTTPAGIPPEVDVARILGALGGLGGALAGNTPLPSGGLEGLLGALGGGGGGGSVGGLDDLFRQLAQSNAKPKTKQSAIDSLPRSTFDATVHKETDCAMCQGKFTAGDSIVTLPCKHYFHGDGTISGDCADCPLVTNFLKNSNECPICRTQLESDVPKLQEQAWKCPGCERDVTGPSCSTCQPNVRRNVSSAYYHEFFNEVETLFLEITDYRLRQQARRAEEAAAAASASSSSASAPANEEDDPESIFNGMKIKQLTTAIDELKLDRKGLSEKSELVKLLVEHSKKSNTKPVALVDSTQASREMATMRSKIDRLMNSSGYTFLATCGWEFSPLKQILERNLLDRLDENISFMTIDQNSRVVMQFVVRRLKRANAKKYPQDKEFKIANDKIEEEEWICSLCSYSNSFSNLTSHGRSRTGQSGAIISEGPGKCKNCPASVSSAIQAMAEEFEPIFKEFLDLVTRCLQLTLRVNAGGISDGEKYEVRSTLKKAIKDFLDSYRFAGLFDQRNFVIKRHLRNLFSRILKYEINFPFVVEGYLDMNSVASFANFVHKIRELVDSTPAFHGVFNFEKPNAESIQQGDSFENFSDQRYKIVDPNHFVYRFLEDSKDVFMVICRAIAFGTTGDQWQHFESFFDQLLLLNIAIKPAIIAMKSGIRDLDTIAHNMDLLSKFVIEALLLKVKHFEMERSFADIDDILDVQSPRGGFNRGVTSAHEDDDAAIIPENEEDDSSSSFSSSSSSAATSISSGRTLLKRQNSIGSDIKNALLDLKLRLSPDEANFAQVIKKLYKVAVNINSDPSKLEYRRLLKDHKNFQLYVAPYSEVLSVLQFMGFVESPNDPTRLFLRHVKRDEIMRTCHVLKEIAAADNIKLA